MNIREDLRRHLVETDQVIDRFTSECRAITNLIGNSVATVAVGRWEGEVTPAQLTANLRLCRER